MPEMKYRWKRHDSLTVRGNKWYRHSQSKGGAPIDFVMEFFGKSFTEAVELLTGEKGSRPAAGQTKPRAPIRLPTATPQHRQPHSEELPHSSPPYWMKMSTGLFSFATRGIFTRKPPTITPYSSAEMKAAYRDTPISAAQPGVFGLM